MRIRYNYKDELFDDVRDIVENNYMTPYFPWFSEVYLPYQVFTNNKTPFLGVTIEQEYRFDPRTQIDSRELTPEDLLQESFDEYDDSHEGAACHLCACSGGTDSSIVALEYSAAVIYSGLYPEKGFDETTYSAEIAKDLGCFHLTFEVTEDEYIDTIDEYLRAICIPIAGLGGVSEYIVLKKALEQYPEVKTVYFGNGGDEIFLGYFYNHMIRELVKLSCNPMEYMPNFLSSKESFIMDNTEAFIDILIRRSNKDKPLIPKIPGDTWIEKMLYVNINFTLPSLLHINNQICRACGVEGRNPISNKTLIDHAVFLNTPLDAEPKKRFKEMCPSLPNRIKERKDKMGFPIPLHKWEKLKAIIAGETGALLRCNLDDYVITREEWGKFMMGRWMRMFG